MVPRFFLFILLVSLLIYLIWDFLNYIINPEKKLIEETVKHNVKSRNKIVDEKVKNMNKNGRE